MGNKITGYIGTYTETTKRNKAEGIYAFTLDGETGGIGDIHLAAESRNPSYLTVAPSKKYLYAVNELDAGQGNGQVSAFRRDFRTGNLELINQAASGGSNPCHVAVNDRETHAVISNYTSGSLAVMPIGPGGALEKAVQVITFTGTGPNAARQEGPHVHSFLFARNFARGFALDLGTDRLTAYSFDPRAEEPLIPAASQGEVSSGFNLPPGSGPRHGVFDASGTHGYILNELDSTVTMVHYNQMTGIFEEPHTISTLPGGCPGTGTIAAGIKITPDGKFVYASNRGHNSITIFKRDRMRGFLSFVDSVSSGGKTPRDFSLDPSGKFLLVCNQDSDNLAVFRVNRTAGKLEQVFEYPVPVPVCVIFPNSAEKGLVR
jgi:6-phosphogluconolactonase